LPNGKLNKTATVAKNAIIQFNEMEKITNRLIVAIVIALLSFVTINNYRDLNINKVRVKRNSVLIYIENDSEFAFKLDTAYVLKSRRVIKRFGRLIQYPGNYKVVNDTLVVSLWKPGEAHISCNQDKVKTYINGESVYTSVIFKPKEILLFEVPNYDEINIIRVEVKKELILYYSM